MNENQIVTWLISGDASIQYQTHRDLLGVDKPELQQRIATEGWGPKLLELRKPNGHWGQGFYQPKWTSTHYTLLDLKNLGIPNNFKEIKDSIDIISRTCKDPDGGINPAKTVANSDVCINGMFLNYACYFGIKQEELISVVDFILSQQLPDGGFNCRLNRSGAKHSSLHTTISTVEGILEYERYGYKYRLDELKKAQKESEEFMLQHKLFKSHRTGEVIDKKFILLSYPSRWRYDILRALDYFAAAKVPYDSRMDDAIEILLKKRRSNGTWPLQAKHPGQSHFDMEEPKKPSRWNTLRALRVMKHFMNDFQL